MAEVMLVRPDSKHVVNLISIEVISHTPHNNNYYFLPDLLITALFTYVVHYDHKNVYVTGKVGNSGIV